MAGTFMGFDGHKLLVGCEVENVAGVRSTTYALNMTEAVQMVTTDLPLGVSIAGDAEYFFGADGVLESMTMVTVEVLSADSTTAQNA